MTQSFIHLDKLGADEQSSVQQLEGGHRFVSRLATLGFTPGVLLTMIQNFGRGPLIVSVRDTRIALGRGEAAKILVRRKNNHV